jgi:hypothetical protein
MTNLPLSDDLFRFQRYLTVVIPAKAGIQGHRANSLPLTLDTRFRGYDGRERLAGWETDLEPSQALDQEIEETLVLALEQDPAIAVLTPVEDRLAVTRPARLYADIVVPAGEEIGPQQPGDGDGVM